MDLNHQIAFSQDPQPGFITLSEAKDHLKAFDHEDDLIQSYLDAAIGAAEDYLGSFILHRDVVIQSSELAIITPVYHGPVIDGDFTVSVTPQTGADQDISSDFELINPWGRDASFVYQGDGLSYPLKSNSSKAVRISYKAGVKTAGDLPDQFKTAILLILSDFYEYRSDRAAINNTRAMALLRPHRVY